MPYLRTVQAPACPIRKVVAKRATVFTLWGFLRVYKRQGGVKVMGGWLWDDVKMRRDEKNSWRSFGIHFGRTFSIWAKGHETMKC